MSSELMEIMELAEKNGIERGMQRGIEQGMQRGIEQGMQRGIEQGIQQGKSESIIDALKMNYITIENASTILNISKEKLEK